MQQFASKQFPLIGFNPLSMQFEKQHRENSLLMGSKFPLVFTLSWQRGCWLFRSSTWASSHKQFCITCFIYVLKNTRCTQLLFLPARFYVKSLKNISKATLEEGTIYVHFFTAKSAVSFSFIKDLGQLCFQLLCSTLFLDASKIQMRRVVGLHLCFNLQKRHWEQDHEQGRE